MDPLLILEALLSKAQSDVHTYRLATYLNTGPPLALDLVALRKTIAAIEPAFEEMLVAMESESEYFGTFCMSHDNRDGAGGSVYCAKPPRHGGPCDYSRHV